MPRAVSQLKRFSNTRPKAWFVAVALAGVWLGSTAHATDLSQLYISDAIVTGTGSENRQIGFRECLREVLVKVSGDFSLIDRPAFAALEEHAAQYVASFSYRDRLEGIPIHDEQGTHDRPHDLTCRFKPATIDPLLAKLGGKPWLSPRPVIAVLLAVKDQRRRFVLARDGDESPYMAASLAAAAVPLALTARLPDAATLAAERLDFVHLPPAQPTAFNRLATDMRADVPLAGTLAWSDTARGWIADWRLVEGGREHRWQISGVSFDDAFRNAMRGASRILSGNGEP